MAANPLPHRLEGWMEWLEAYAVQLRYRDDPPALECCRLALEAVEDGNFGIGCVLHDPGGHEVIRGRSSVFGPVFRSGRHAEMVVLDAFEDRFRNATSMKGYTLYSSLEPCPMCLARIITSGCGAVRYVAPDDTGGMVHLMHHLPPVWLDLASGRTPPQVFARADCSPELQRAGLEILRLSGDEMNRKLIDR